MILFVAPRNGGLWSLATREHKQCPNFLTSYGAEEQIYQTGTVVDIGLD